MDNGDEEPPQYKHITRNDFVCRKHKKQKEEDVAICDCEYNANDSDSPCGDGCLNVLTNTECTPEYCPCGVHCKNQKFQKCEYAKSKLFKTEGRGWGLLADEFIKAGQFVIEYCGEVISWKEAKRRSQAYEYAGLKDAYIIYLNSDESIDATQKGSVARFINHSCQPNCETRKWNVLGEVRVGIFAKQDIPAGTELSYNYNFEWFGGAKVRCLCGAECCSGFLGAKSRGFQEATYLWEDDDDRYSVENVPLYDSEDDEPSSKFLKAIVPYNEDQNIHKESEDLMKLDEFDPAMSSQSVPMVVEPLNFAPSFGPMETDELKYDGDSYLHSENSDRTLKQNGALMSNVKSSSIARNNKKGTSPATKALPHGPGGRSKVHAKKQVNVKLICQRLATPESREEISACEELRQEATTRLDNLYDEIRPAIEEHERDSQDSVSTSVAEKWIEASCAKMKADFNFYFAVIKNIANNPRGERRTSVPHDDDITNDIKYLENGH